MIISRHLRDEHGYSLAQSIARAPREMAELHEREHAEGNPNHRHMDKETWLGEGKSGAHSLGS